MLWVLNTTENENVKYQFGESRVDDDLDFAQRNAGREFYVFRRSCHQKYIELKSPRGTSAEEVKNSRKPCRIAPLLPGKAAGRL